MIPHIREEVPTEDSTSSKVASTVDVALPNSADGNPMEEVTYDKTSILQPTLMDVDFIAAPLLDANAQIHRELLISYIS